LLGHALLSLSNIKHPIANHRQRVEWALGNCPDGQYSQVL
jgi:hypothetical protein